MYTDIVMPSGNEEAFLRVGKQLGCGALIFLYESPPSRRDIREVAHEHGVKVCLAALPKGKSIKKPSFADYLFAQSENPRQFIERPQVSLVYGTETSHPRRFMHHRGSGLNQVLCRIAAQKETAIGFDISRIQRSAPTERARILGCMRQNVQFARKFGVMMRIASFAEQPYSMRGPKDVMSFGVSLGMHPREARDAITLQGDESAQ